MALTLLGAMGCGKGKESCGVANVDVAGGDRGAEAFGLIIPSLVITSRLPSGPNAKLRVEPCLASGAATAVGEFITGSSSTLASGEFPHVAGNHASGTTEHCPLPSMTL